MDWTIIISAVFGSISIGELIYILVNPKAARKKPEIENKQAEANVESTSIAAMKDAIDELRKSNDHFQEINEQREEKIVELREELTECQKDLAISTSWICKMGACSLRKPCRGAGEKWLKDLKAGEDEPDYTPIPEGKLSITNIE